MQTAISENEMKDGLVTAWSQSKSRLISDFRTLVQEAEELLRAASGVSGEGFVRARAKFEEKLGHLKETADEAKSYASDAYQKVAAEANDYVVEKPWQAVGIAAAVGILIGIALGSQRSDD